jgi:hypothetical protein
MAPLANRLFKLSAQNGSTKLSNEKPRIAMQMAIRGFIYAPLMKGGGGYITGAWRGS